MNYITWLKRDVDALRAAKDEAEKRILDFRIHLTTDKFQSTASERRDWIATGDVERRLREIEDALRDVYLTTSN